MNRWSWILVLAVALAAACFAACNYTDGACYVRGEGPGAGNGAGGGPIVPGGPGGYGEAPPDPGPDGVIEDCNLPEEPEPLNEVICGRPTWGALCRGPCAKIDAICEGDVRNTITNKTNLLYKCCGCKGGQCWYVDPDNTESGCVYGPAMPGMQGTRFCK